MSRILKEFIFLSNLNCGSGELSGIAKS